MTRHAGPYAFTVNIFVHVMVLMVTALRFNVCIHGANIKPIYLPS